MRKTKTKRLILVALAILLGAGYSVPALAATGSNNTNSGGSTNTSSKSSSSSQSSSSSGITQSYNADPSVQVGMLVRLKPQDPSTVVPLPNNAIQDMLGVVIPPSNATIVLTPQNIQKQQVLVATTGHYNVLVSNQNGPIKVGDYITVSAIDGVGMKADAIENEVLGKAAGNFSGTSNVIGTMTLKNTLGHAQNVAIGSVPVDVNISHNPLFQKTADYVPSILAKAAVAVANKPVTASRIYLCIAILFITAIVTGNMLYSGVRSGMIAVGRNPLSKKSIIKSLIETVIAGLIIFVIGVFAVYLLLKL